MKKIYLLVFGLLLFSLEYASAVKYVDGTAIGSNNGSTWENAYTDLATAITEAADDEEIYVAGGTYSITASLPYKAVKIYGGFSTTQTAPADRTKGSSGKPWDFANPTIIDANGWSASAERIFVSATAATDLLLDGLTFQNRTCTANASIIYARAGLIMQNCIVQNNTSTKSNSDADGGTVFLHTGITGTFLIKDCKIANNDAAEDRRGGAICINDGTATVAAANVTVHITGCELNNNKSRNGSAISLRDNVFVLVENTTMIGNESSYEGGAIRQEAGMLLLQNCVLAKNKTKDNTWGHGAAIYSHYTNVGGVNDTSTTLSILNCVIADNTSNRTTDNAGAALNGPANVCNTIFGNNNKGDVSGTPTGFYYNIIAALPTGVTGAMGATNITGTVNADALFTDATGGDYSTKDDSPAIDAGKVVLRDKDNKPVPTWVKTSIGILTGDPVYFRLFFPTRGEKFVTDVGVGTNVETKAVDKNDDAQLWTFIPAEKGYRIVNKLTGREFAKSSSSNDIIATAGSGYIFRIEACTNNKSGLWMLRTGDGTLAFNKYSSGNYVGVWGTSSNNDDDGNALAFVPETDPAVFAAPKTITFNMIVNGINSEPTAGIWAHNFEPNSAVNLTKAPSSFNLGPALMADDNGYARFKFSDIPLPGTVTLSHEGISVIYIVAKAVLHASTDGDDHDHWYYIRAAGDHKRNMVFQYNGDKKQILYAGPAVNLDAQLWKIVKTATGNKIVNKVDGGSLVVGDDVDGGSGGNFYSTLAVKSSRPNDSDARILFDIANDGIIKIQFNSPDNNWSWIGHDGSQELRNTQSNTSADLFKFVTPEAMSAEGGHLTISTNDDDDHWYYIRAAGTHKQNMVFQYNGDKKQILYASPVVNLDAQLWKIVKTATGHKIVNKVDGGSLAVGDEVDGGSDGNFYSTLTVRTGRDANNVERIRFEIANDETVKIQFTDRIASDDPQRNGWPWIGHDDDQELRNCYTQADADLFKFVTPEAMSAEGGHLTISTNEDGDHWYYIRAAGDHKEDMVFHYNGDKKQIFYADPVLNLDAQLWKIIKTATGYKIVNKVDGGSLVVGDDVDGGSGGNFYSAVNLKTDRPDDSDARIVFEIANDETVKIQFTDKTSQRMAMDRP